jgi:TatD DNase family protein
VIAFVDSHAHLQEPEFAGDRDAVIERALAAGIGAIVVPAVDLETSAAALGLAETNAGVYATAGYHPHEASKLTQEKLEGVGRLLSEARVVAVGEAGLDYYRLHSPREAQLAAFEAMLGLAERHALPIVVHCRDAWADMLPMLTSWSARVRPRFAGRPLGVMHYFTGTSEDAQRYADLGFSISIHTSVTHPKAASLREVAATLPLESLVIETDSPYGAPQTYRGKRNEPAYVVEAAKAIAAARGIDLDTVAAVTTANAHRIFSLPAIATPHLTGAPV